MMDRSDVVDVLTAVAAGTGREIGEVDVVLWQNVIGDVPKQFALDAVLAHFRECPGVWLEPGHVFSRWRAFRRDQLDREPDQIREARQAELDARLVAAIDSFDESDKPGRVFPRPSQSQEGKPNPLAVRCPWCRAGEFRPCRIPDTNFQTRNPHPSRVELAESKGETA